MGKRPEDSVGVQFVPSKVPYFICYMTMVAWRSVEGWGTRAVIC